MFGCSTVQSNLLTRNAALWVQRWSVGLYILLITSGARGYTSWLDPPVNA
jgi:hypothetical protein